jgi:DNA-directed RNA polymerase subunit beta'
VAGTHVFDPEAQWKSVVGAIETELPSLLNVEGKSRDLVLRRAYFDDAHPLDDLEGQRKALLEGTAWSIPVYGDLEVRDKDGTSISQSKKVPLFRVPQLTPRHGYILGGSEFQIANQLRLKSGAYTRVKENGDLETFVNLARGGRSYLTLNPEDGRVRMRVGTASPALYPLLQTLGVPEKKIVEAFGEDLYERNRHSRAEVEIPKLYRALFRRPAPSFEQAQQEIRERYANSEISPETTRMTLGKSFDRADGEFFLRAAQKLIGVQRGVEKPDRRDSPAFKELLGADDIFRERLAGPTRREIQYRIRRRLDPRPGQKVRTRVREIIEPQRLQKIIDAQFNASQLSRHPDHINPLEMVQNAAQITLTGEGGIRDRQMITIPMRNVDPGFMGFIDPLHTPEGGSVGVVQHLAIGTGKKGREMTTSIFNVRTKKFEERTPAELHEATVALPATFSVAGGQVRPKEDAIPAYREGEFVYVRPEEVDYVFPGGKQLLDYSSNLVPFANSASGGRLLMAARHQQQAVALKEREAPLVKASLRGVPFTKLIGPLSGAMHAPAAGKVSKITDREIVLETKKGEVRVPLYRNFPLNSKSYLHNEPKVVVGDKVEQGDLVADSTFTRDGELALGKNLLVAYVPYKDALTFEDAIVVSESGAKKLTSLHQYRKDIPKGEGWKASKKTFISYFPARFKRGQVDHIQGNGLPEIGAVLQKGDPVALVLRRREVSESDKMLGRLSRNLVQPYKDQAVVWEEDVPGRVVDVIAEGTEMTVLIQTEEPAVAGDKVSGRHGNKGIISKVVPDSEMLRTKDGEVIDIVMNPLGVPTRMNDSQMIEALVGRAAEKLGRPALVDNFRYENNEELAREIARKAGVPLSEALVDPGENIELEDVLVGRTYVHKLDHPVRKKFSARSTGTYTADLVPAKRSGESAQSIDPMTLYSILAHGAKANVREMSSLKAEDRPEVWRALIMGESLPPPKPTFAYSHLQGLLRAAGARTERHGKWVRLAPINDQEILATSRGPITEPRMFLAKTLKPERGGLFDPVITGGTSGENWAHVPLAEPIPNPVFEKAILSITGLTEDEYRSVLDGRSSVRPDGKVRSEPAEGDAIAGGRGIQRLLRSIDLRSELDKVKAQIPKAREEKLNILNRRARYLSNLVERQIDPGTFVLENLPVLPPRFRPFYAREDGTMVVSDLNNLYRDVVWVNKQLREAHDMEGLPEGQKSDLRRDLYDSAKALMGFGAPLSDPNLRGVFTTIRGAGKTKSGFFQQHVLRRRQELTGRSTITPDGALGVDEVGIPDAMLWKIFKPFVLRGLVQQGSNRTEAEQLWKDKDSRAKTILEHEAENRPVFLNRAPSLHRHSFLPMKPVPSGGLSIRLNPLIVKGFNADFDGDTMAVHVPVTGAAVAEAKELLPSKQALSASGDILVAPRYEATIGLNLITSGDRDRGRSFSSEADALLAADAGKVDLGELVSVGGRKTTPGRILVNKVLPPKLRSDERVFTQKEMQSVLTEIALNNPKTLPSVLDALKTIGFQSAYRLGFSVPFGSLREAKGFKDRLVARAQEQIVKVPIEQRAEKVLELYGTMGSKLNETMRRKLSKNPFIRMASSGSRGSMDQVRQVIGAPLLMSDAENKTVPYPIRRSYAEGLTPAEFWIGTFGGRKGVVDVARRQAEPGAITKSLIASAIDSKISMHDCGTRRGRSFPLQHDDVLGRALADPAGRFPRNETLTDDVIGALERDGVGEVRVRTPSTCDAPHGVCSLCYGLDERMRLPSLHTPVGILSSQAIMEPASQSMLGSKHRAGIAEREGAVADGIERIRNLLQFPKTFKNKGTIARRFGEVTHLEPNPAGGHRATIDGEDHLIAPGRDPLIRLGQEVRPGDPISTGFIDPKDVLQVQGPIAAREFVADSLRDVYLGTGKRIPRRHFETVARAVTNTTRILDPAGQEGLLEGDITSLDPILAANIDRKRTQDLPLRSAVGAALAEDIREVGGLGKILSDADVDVLQKRLRRHTVRANPRPVIHQPILRGIDMLPDTRKDWLSHMAHRRLKKVLEEGIPQGWQSDISEGSLLPAYLAATG